MQHAFLAFGGDKGPHHAVRRFAGGFPSGKKIDGEKDAEEQIADKGEGGGGRDGHAAEKIVAADQGDQMVDPVGPVNAPQCFHGLLGN